MFQVCCKEQHGGGGGGGVQYTKLNNPFSLSLSALNSSMIRMRLKALYMVNESNNN